MYLTCINCAFWLLLVFMRRDSGNKHYKRRCDDKSFKTQMAVEPEARYHSSLGFKYPEHRDAAMHTMDSWLQDKRETDGAEGLWRIQDDLYDLTNFVANHPGGPDWLNWTKGTDITEAFESCHLTSLAETILPKYYVRKAKSPRSSPFTFHEKGFYRTLKGRVREALKTAPAQAADRSKFLADMLLLGYLITALLATILRSYAMGVASGMLLGMLTIAAHNFFHQRDNFRMYYFDFSFLSSKEWRISHAISHHLYPNTIIDLEISSLEPFLMYLPVEKHILRRIISWIISPIFYTAMFIMSFVYRIIASFKNEITHVSKRDTLPILMIAFMYITSGRPFLEALTMWFFILCVGSFHFGLIGLSASHHHPKIFHDGDAIREDKDWGIFQMDAIMDRKELTGSHFLVLTNFGDHTLHHLFPTVDHGHLNALYPILIDTCAEFGIRFRMKTFMQLMIGQFRQLFRVLPNDVVPGGSKKIS